ncbi:sensor histidine kinase [Curtobacterium sp. Leaf261]|uniref:sensor histidine kinase n=1 Tax=Curtobacterium sp. Leaf261 TaxID=1736311 RepID=UPI0006F53F35|nr:histidine kinase [Curtobacterium sp. Leaf261]KQO61469.1 hypothetical protein ASF23_13500 [Curtobacterium sp. Leaf261]
MAQEATDTAPVSVRTDAPRASRPRRSFPWAIAPSATPADVAAARRRWYAGATFGLLWQSLLVIALWTDGRPLAEHVLGSVTLLVVYAAYLGVPELMWRRGLPSRVGIVTAFAALCGLTLLSIGPIAVWSWLLVASLTGFIALRMWVAGLGIAVIVAAQLAVSAVVGWDAATDSGLLFAPLVTVSVGLSMVFFGRQRDAEDQLDVANDELTRLAVVEERARFSRDLHDVLGHSLTVVTMKSELAARLVDLDPDRAKAEIADIERLSREALQGLRQAVGGYREADLDAELVAACAAFRAAGVEASVPDDGAAAARDVRSLFAWVLREGVTNVLRHAAATHARVTITRTALTVEDDGTGASGDVRAGGGIGGNGLLGLRERAEAVGAVISTGTSDLGGFLLRVQRGRR